MTGRLTVIVVAFHRPTQLRNLLSAITDPSIDVVVVNIESDTEVSRVVAGTKELQTAVNIGYAAAINFAVGSVETELVVFTNDDVETTPAAIQRLTAAVASGEADVTVPMVLDERFDVERTIAALPTPRTLLIEWALLPDAPVPALGRFLEVQKWRLPSVPERIEAAAATVVATRTDLLRSVPLPEEYFMYWEEMEWFWRLRERNAVVQFRPEATVLHRGGRGDVRAEKSRLLARNAVRCVRRTQGRDAALRAAGVVVLWNVRLLVVAAARSIASCRTQRRRLLTARLAGLGAALLAWREAL